MPTIITHAVVGTAAGWAFASEGMPARFWVLAAFCPMIPDLDVAAFPLGIPYGDFWGHRGFLHSPAFALVSSLLLALVFFWGRSGPKSWPALWAFLFLITASHGILDAFTDGGLGIALLAPLDNGRYFFPVRPIAVSPIGAGAFFTERGLRVMASEVVWVWLPVLAGAAGWRVVGRWLGWIG